MTLNYSAMLPHGFNLIPELYPDEGDDWQRLVGAMEKISDEIVRKDPEVIILASPHNLRIDGYVGIIASEWLEGTWWNENKTKKVTLRLKCDRDFANLLYDRTKDRIPIVSVNYGAADGDYSEMKMDWGTMIPLWTVYKKYKESNKSMPSVVLITPSREIPWKNLVYLGHTLSNICEKENKNAVFIASCDHGHAHDPKGSYGYHPASKVFDEQICSLVRKNQLDTLLELTPEFIDQAKPDSFWQMLILLGIVERSNLKNELCLYECPSYYGMIVASFK